MEKPGFSNHDYFFFAPRRRPRPGTVFLIPLRVRAFVRVPDILVNHKLIAKGEVVVIDENFGVRVTEIVSQIDRMNELT